MILVTGASGYLGQYVVKHLRAAGISPLLNVDDLAKPVVPRTGVTRILHLAAKTPKTIDDYARVSLGSDTLEMMLNIITAYRCPIVLASSHVASQEGSVYAKAKWFSEYALQHSGLHHCIVRLPGLFGLPRRSGTVYEAAIRGQIADRYGHFPSMHVDDAAQAFVRIALAFPDEGECESHEISYETPAMLKARVQQFAEELACQPMTTN